MRPDVTRVLGGVAATIAGSLMPELTTPFARATAATSAGILGMIAQEFDRAAARQVEENDAIRQILALAVDVVDEDGLTARCADVLESPPERDYRVSTLKAENDILRGLLIDVHAHAESRDDAAALNLVERIWDELRASTRRRTLKIGG